MLRRLCHSKPVLGLAMAGLLAATVVQAQSDNDALKTKQGAPLKVIVREPAAIHDRPDKASPSRPVSQFEFFYVLPTTNGGQEKLQNGFYRVASAPRYAAQAGWVSSDTVLEWSHAQVLGFRPKAQRTLTLFFAERSQVEKWYSGDDSVRPISREPAQLLSGAQLFPLLDVGTFEYRGDKIEVYKVAYLQTAAANGAEPHASKEKLPDKVSLADLERDFVLQVVFVLDTTNSMQPFIDAAKKVIAMIADELARDPALRGRIEFSLVTYRDRLKDEDSQRQMEYVAKVVCDFSAGTDHKEFQRRLESVHEASLSSEDVPEDGLAGLKLAVQKTGWKKTSYKHIIVIGDASFHIDADSYKNTERLTIPGLLALAQPTGSDVWQKIQIHGLRIVSTHSSDHRRCKEHFDQLTAGREFAGLHYEYAGPQDAPKFIEQLSTRLRQMVGYTSKVATGKTRELVQEAQQAAPGSEQHRLLGPILEMLQATDDKASGSAPTFTEGYAPVLDRDGNRALEPHVLVTHGRLDCFASALDFFIKALEDAGDPGNRDVQKIVSSLQILATTVNLGEPVTADMPLEKLLSLVLGFPVRNQVFSKTPAQLAAMTSRDYQAWVQQVRASETIVRGHLSNGSLWFLLGGVPGRQQDRHAFIKVSDLP